MKMIPDRLRLATVLLACALSQPASAALAPAGLRCEYAVDPLGVDSPRPRLFWTVESKERGQRQTAYRILAASSEKNLTKNDGDLWDSGKVASDETIHVPYGGKPLETAQQVFWKVCVWDAHGKASAWSRPSTWTMGVLADSDWTGRWIVAPETNFVTVLFRREFTVKPGLKRALINVCGLGQFELTLDGKKVGDDWLSPGWTKFDKTCLYDTRELTARLGKGKHAVGLLLGGGMYDVPQSTRFSKFRGSFGPLKAIAQLRLEYSDGSVDLIGTDETWRAAPGPITFSSMYGGEDFDARLVQRGWDKPGFDDSKWPAARVFDGVSGSLRGLSCAAPPIHEFEVFKPVASRELTNGVTVYDLGQNAALVARLQVRGPAGSRVRIIPAELVDTNGFADRGSCGGRRGLAYWQYTLAGDGTEDYFSKFFYHGSRYFQVECSPSAEGGELPVVKQIEGVVVQSSSRPVGEFECSNPLFNRIRKLVRWAQRSNMMSVMTDCPHRERLGWLEEDHLNGPALRYEFDLAQLFTKTLNDIADSQLADGLVPTTAPEYTIFRDRTSTSRARNNFGDSPEWSSTFILVPWQQYQFDGDLELFRHHYGAMKHYLAYFGSRATDYIVDYGLGDWYDVGPRAPGVSQLTPIALTATAFYYCDTRIMADVAAQLGETGDAKQFGELAAKIRAAFNEKFYDPAARSYATGSQTANAIPLVMGLCEPSNRAAVVEAIVHDVRSRTNALTAGDVGYGYLVRALADGGRSDVLFDINNQSDKPGYGYQLDHGATSLTEAWDARRASSQNHFMLGQIQEWFYRDLAGIGGDPAGPGFKKIIINPQPVGDLAWAKAGYDSIRGRIESDWKRDRTTFTLRVRIPANTTATVRVPASSPEAVQESGKTAAQSEGVKFLVQENGRAVFAVESGVYEFKSLLQIAGQD